MANTKTTQEVPVESVPTFCKEDLVNNAATLGYSPEVVVGALYGTPEDAQITKEQLTEAVEKFLTTKVRRKEGK